MDLEAEIERLFTRYPSPIGRDLKLTLRRALTALPPEAAAPVLLGLASAVRDAAIAELAERWMRALAFTDAQVREAVESAAIFKMINTYYSFRDQLEVTDEPAGLTMTATARPALGKHAFERLALAHSVLNKCRPCIRFHEQKLRALGSSVEETRDLARLAAAVAGCDGLP